MILVFNADRAKTMNNENLEQADNGIESISQCATDRRELRIELPLEVVTRLSQRAASEGVSLEQLVAQVIARLAK